MGSVARADLLDEPTTGVKDVALAPVQQTADGLIAAIERLAANPQVDVEKLERIIALQERILRVNAETAFNEAFAAMQPKIPVILESKNGDGGKWAYAPLEDIVETVRPILAAHGFTLSHQTEWPDPKTVKVIGILTHAGGHARRSEFQASADQSGSKNAIQALGSSNHYGRRYTTNDLLCIVTRGADDNGDKSGREEPPDGYDERWTDLVATAQEGTAALDRAWTDLGKTKPGRDFKAYTVNQNREKWNALKAKAAQVKAS